MRIVIPGGSGQVGTVLARHFHTRGHQVCVLARQLPLHPPPWQRALWNARALGDWVHHLDAADVVINLAGRSVNCRYNAANRKEILESRTLTTSLIGHAIASVPTPPKLWLNASTATIYAHSLDQPNDDLTGTLGGKESHAPSTWRFSIEVAKAWEDAFFHAPTPHTRRVALRSAMTMSPSDGGIFATLLGLVRAGLGGTAASGQQYISWIHEADFLAAIDFLIARNDLEGPVNLSSPHPLPNREFMATLRRAWGAPIGLPATEWMLEIGALLLSTESELILKSRRVLPTRLLQAGFGFAFPDWAPAAADLVRRYRQRS
jgi:uncharacterized protein